MPDYEDCPKPSNVVRLVPRPYMEEAQKEAIEMLDYMREKLVKGELLNLIFCVQDASGMEHLFAGETFACLALVERMRFRIHECRLKEGDTVAPGPKGS